MLGIIPAAGAGSRIQPLAFSKELLPVGSRADGGIERPRAVSEYLVDRMVLAGATRIGFVISPHKSDIVAYFGDGAGGARAFYVVQPRPDGLCDAIFRALPFAAGDEDVLVGLPDTVWFPEDGLARLPGGGLALLLFPVARPSLFDAVITDERGAVREIQVKQPAPRTRWVWGALRAPAAIWRELASLWIERGGGGGGGDQYLGSLVNAWLARGGRAIGVRAGAAYVDVGTLHGYREALSLLQGRLGARAAIAQGTADARAPNFEDTPAAAAGVTTD